MDGEEMVVPMELAVAMAYKAIVGVTLRQGPPESEPKPVGVDRGETQMNHVNVVVGSLPIHTH